MSERAHRDHIAARSQWHMEQVVRDPASSRNIEMSLWEIIRGTGLFALQRCFMQ